MPGLLSTLRHPRREPPAPVHVDMRHVILVGMAAWAVGLVVAVVLALVETASWLPTWMCVAGLILGVLMLGWVRRQPA